MLTINNPVKAASTQTITLSGITYEFSYYYNSRNERMYLSISVGGESVVSNIKIVESSDLLGRYILNNFDHGTIICVRNGCTTKPATLGNIGVGLCYSLLYLTNDELDILRNFYDSDLWQEIQADSQQTAN